MGSFKKPPEQPQYADLITSLDNSRQQIKDNALWQTVYILLQRLTKSKNMFLDDLKDLEALLDKFKNISFLTQDDETILLPNSRRLLESLGIDLDDSIFGEKTIRLTHYWNVLTDGATPPELISADGDAIACEVPYDDIAPFFPMGR
jgi:hypothetical protein